MASLYRDTVAAAPMRVQVEAGGCTVVEAEYDLQ
jgi:hypothetical protein